MVTANSVLMSEARENLKGRWRLAINGAFFLAGISIVLNFLSNIPYIGFLFSIILFIINGFLYIGTASFFLKFSKKEDVKVSEIYLGYKVYDNYLHGLKAILWKFWYSFFWYLLLIVPGIIKSISYSQFYYILAEDKNIDLREALKKSKDMMDGNKMKYFKLQLRFIGWAFLCILTLGIGIIWLAPWIQVTLAKFYEDVKGNTGPVTTSTATPSPAPTPIAQATPIVAEVIPTQAK